MRSGARFSVRIVSNGLILTWFCEGLGALKEPHKEYQGVYIFKNWEELTSHVKLKLSE